MAKKVNLLPGSSTRKLVPKRNEKLIKMLSEKSFSPELNKIYLFQNHSILVLESGKGLFQVDFSNYDYAAGKALFLSPGQYFRLLAGQYQIRILEFSGEKVQDVYDSRFLFKHLISLGYIDVNHPKLFYEEPEVQHQNTYLLNRAITHWLALNPFNTSQKETHLLFDLKDIVDDRYREPVSMDWVAKKLAEKSYRIKLLTKEKLNRTVVKLTKDKLLLEAQRKVVFTAWTTKEIAYELGFSDPNYFNRFFKLHTRKTPYEFRENYQVDERDTFVRDLLSLIDAHYKEHHTMAFYAGQLHMSVKNLSKKLHQQLDRTVHQLIKEKILNEAKNMLQAQRAVNVIAFELGFKEPNHFSVFFKRNTGQTPTAYQTNF
ncbi:AraC family transcriptional regulator [Rapidithrix thailandica]|uniref:AraC family transcriptional regulator n=1 Tax=Rapidithrix thailandica TaxID=413964 RepID=A0AAW9SCA0_9BACT